MDLSEAFDTLNHNLPVTKRKPQSLDSSAVSFIIIIAIIFTFIHKRKRFF